MVTAEKRKKVVSVIPATKVLEQQQSSIESKKLRVAAYCRVSTEKEEQQLSFKAQVEYYKFKIINNPNWELVDIYSDDGISATNTKKRIGFNNLINDCMNGKIDMVLTKSISRFARNTVDCITYIRMLKEKNIPIIFEKENINTMDSTGEFIITILGSIAQEESRTLSTNTKWGLAHRFEKGQVSFTYSKFLGYKKDEDGKIVIVEEEAKIVRKIYQMYIQGKSLTEIKHYLEENKIKTVTGKDKWSTTTINSILSNEKYIGDALLQKSYTVDYINKKRVKNKGEMKQYYVEGNHEPIISKVLYNLVQEEKARRSSLGIKYKKSAKTSIGKHTKYALSELMVCGECGKPYKRTSWTNYKNKKIVWRCVNRLENGKRYCKNSPTLEDETLKKAIMNKINSIISNKEDFKSELTQSIKEIMDNYTVECDKENVEKQIYDLKNKMFELIDKNAKNKDKNYTREYENLSFELKQLQYQRGLYEEREILYNTYKKRIHEMKEFLEDIDGVISEFDEEIIRQLIEKVVVISKDKIMIKFKSGIEAEQVIENVK